MSGDPRDAALLASCPCLPVPRFGDLPGMELGQRTLVASNGVFTQAKLRWLDCILRIASLPESPPLPYGALQERITFSFGVIPMALLDEFIEHGRAALPNEAAGALVHCATRNNLRLELHEPIEAGPAGIRYRMPALVVGESVAVDLHTHGRLPAFWSSIDDADDRGVKVCGVFGSLDKAVPSAAFRLALNGMYRGLPHPWEATGAAKATSVDDETRWPTLSAMGFIEASEWSI
jgi:PRTRC genetic system protein A